MRKKRTNQKPEEFVGWKSEDGLLEVIGFTEKIGKFRKFKVVCNKCSNDKELFPERYFYCYKSTLVENYKPCGCGKNTRWTKDQFNILVKRSLGDNIIFSYDKYSGSRTKLKLKCLIDGCEWNSTIRRVIYSKQACPACAKARHKESASGFYGYYPDRKYEVDYLYTLNFNGKFIKVGRSFDVDERVRGLRSDSKIKKIQKLRIFTATHQEIYDTEQELHSELRERNFQHYVKWSTECFTSDSLPYLNMLLDKCGVEEVKL